MPPSCVGISLESIERLTEREFMVGGGGLGHMAMSAMQDYSV